LVFRYNIEQSCTGGPPSRVAERRAVCECTRPAALCWRGARSPLEWRGRDHLDILRLLRATGEAFRPLLCWSWWRPDMPTSPDVRPRARSIKWPAANWRCPGAPILDFGLELLRRPPPQYCARADRLPSLPPNCHTCSEPAHPASSRFAPLTMYRCGDRDAKRVRRGCARPHLPSRRVNVKQLWQAGSVVANIVCNGIRLPPSKLGVHACMMEGPHHWWPGGGS
jgi:hypothetical protein